MTTESCGVVKRVLWCLELLVFMHTFSADASY
jgi:hypothetical protein